MTMTLSNERTEKRAHGEIAETRAAKAAKTWSAPRIGLQEMEMQLKAI